MWRTRKGVSGWLGAVRPCVRCLGKGVLCCAREGARVAALGGRRRAWRARGGAGDACGRAAPRHAAAARGGRQGRRRPESGCKYVWIRACRCAGEAVARAPQPLPQQTPDSVGAPPGAARDCWVRAPRPPRPRADAAAPATGSSHKYHHPRMLRGHPTRDPGAPCCLGAMQVPPEQPINPPLGARHCCSAYAGCILSCVREQWAARLRSSECKGSELDSARKAPDPAASRRWAAYPGVPR